MTVLSGTCLMKYIVLIFLINFRSDYSLHAGAGGLINTNIPHCTNTS